MTNTHRSTVTGPTGLHLPTSPVPPVLTGHCHRSHRSSPATAAVPPVFTCQRHRSSPATAAVPPVFTCQRHRSSPATAAVPPVFTGHRSGPTGLHRPPQRSHRSSPANVTGPTGLHRPTSPVPPVFTGHRRLSHRFPPATVTGPTAPYRPPSPIPPVLTGYRHRFHPVFIGLCRQGTSQCHYAIESIGIVGIDFD